MYSMDDFPRFNSGYVVFLPTRQQAEKARNMSARKINWSALWAKLGFKGGIAA